MKKTLLCIISLYLTIVALSQTPKFHWAKKMLTLNLESSLTNNQIILDDSDNIYVIGVFESTKDFDPGPGVFNMTSTSRYNMYIQKLNPDGNFLWAKSFASRDDANPTSIFLDKKNQIYITGSYLGPVDFDPGMGVYYLSTYSSNDIFVLKLDSFGNFIWVKSMGGLGIDRGMSIVVDTIGNVYTSGIFSYPDSDFDPGPSIFYLSFSGFRNSFISKLDSNGNFVWAKSFTGVAFSSTESRKIKLDKTGNLFVSGIYIEKTDFDPGVGVKYPDSTNGIFLVKISATGNFIWLKEFPGISSTYTSFQMDYNENLIISGQPFNKSIDVDPGPGSYIMTKPVDKDWGIVIKLTKNGDLIWAKNLEGSAKSSIFIYCGGVDLNNNLFFNVYCRDTVDVDPGPAFYPFFSASNFDTYLLKLDSNGNFNWVTQFDDSIHNAYSSLSKRGNIYCNGMFRKKADFDPSIETHYLYSDSTFPTSFILKISRCQSITNISTTACNYFKIGDKTYTESGIYQPNFVSADGCDSIINLNLVVNHLNDSVEKSAYTLSSKAIGTSYQWVKCPGYTMVVGATSKTFIPTLPGSYAVVIKKDGCIDTSECYSVYGTGIENNFELNDVILSPNPNKGTFEIKIGKHIIGAKMTIHNLFGQKIIDSELKVESTTQTLNSGFYIINIRKGTQRISKKVEVE